MRILCLTSSYPRHGQDIAGRFVLEHCNALIAQGHHVHVLTWSAPSNRPEFRVPDDRYNLVPHDRIDRIRYAPRQLERLFYGAGAPENIAAAPWLLGLVPAAFSTMVFETLRRAHTTRPDLIIGHWLLPAGFIARLCGRILGIPSLVIGHSGGVHLIDRLPPRAARPIAEFIAGGPMTLPTEELRRKLARHAPVDHVEILPMGFEPAPEMQSKTRSEARRKDWLFMGRLVPIKGLDLAIEAFSRANLPPSTRLHIAGDGPLRPSYQAMEHPNIVFHGFVTGEKKENLLNSCAFFLLTSKTLATGRHEGLPVSLLEVSDRAIIPLTTDIPGVASYLANPALQRFTDRDPNQWARRIEEMSALDEGTRAALTRDTRAQVAPLRWANLGPRWNEFLLNCV